MPKSHGKEKRAAKQKKRRQVRQKARAERVRSFRVPEGADLLASCGYDAEQSLPEGWLALPEQERLDRVARYHERALDPKRLPPSMQRHSGMHVGVENQLASGQPPQVGDALARLMRDGMSRHDAVHALGWVMTEHMRRAVEARRAVDNDAYLRDLEELTLPRWLEMAGVK
jgi:hypothetical protein